MICRCLKCGKDELHYKGSKSGESVMTFNRLKSEIEALSVLKLNRRSTSNTLCIDCMKELLMWLKDKDAHVQIERMTSSGSKRDTPAVQSQLHERRVAEALAAPVVADLPM